MPDATWETALTFSEEENFSASFSEDEDFNTDFEESVPVLVGDHRELEYRDAADQHPISAITDLEAELNVRPSSALTNQDIQNILNT